MNEQRARDVVEHLQTAALEVIESIRALLDVVDDLLRDPTRLTAIVDDITDVARRVGNTTTAAGDTPSDPGVTRIPVS